MKASPTLSEVIELTRLQLDRQLPAKQRIQSLWSAAKAARSVAPADVLAAGLFQLASEAGLTADLNNCRPKGAGIESVRHVIDWACRGINPFETGPLL